MGLFGNQLANVVEWEQFNDEMIFWKWSNKEIKKLLPEIEKNNIRSNVDLEKIIGKERYVEIEDKIKFIE